MWTKFFFAQGTITVQEGSGADHHDIVYWERSNPQQKYVIVIFYDDGSINKTLGIYDAAIPMIYKIRTYRRPSTIWLG